MKMLIVTLIYSLLLIGLNSYQIHAKLDPMEVHFWLYTNDNLELDQYENMIFDGEKVTLDPDTKFDPSRPTKLVAHGLGGGFHIDQFFAEAYARADQNYNIIGIDWRKIHNNNGLGWKNVLENVGRYVAHFVQDMATNHGLKIEEMHAIGFSYGTHVIGFTGVHVNDLGLGKISRGTLLDPVHNLGGAQSAKENFAYVDVIHTSKLGALEWIGHIDFYPNGGEIQPCTCNNPCPDVDCNINEGQPNDHKRAPALFEESIANENKFLSWKCPDNMDYEEWEGMGIERSCPLEETNTLVSMGEYSTANGLPEGVFYLKTNGKTPYSCSADNLLCD